MSKPIDKPAFKDLAGLREWVKVYRVAEWVLKISGAVSEETALRNRDVVRRGLEEFGELSLNENTFWQTLTSAIKDPESPITSAGPKKGIYLSALAVRVSEELEDGVATAATEKPNRQRVQREALLYPIVQGWLIEQNYASNEIASGKKLGKWGNPDLAGIRGIEHFGALHIEITTVEVKTSIDNWEYFIFESVSHRRFANRSYFAFAHPWKLIQKFPEELRYYCERFQVGALMLGTDDEVYEDLAYGASPAALEPDAVEIIELFAAPFTTVHPEHQQRFLSTHGINTQKDLWKWGE